MEKKKNKKMGGKAPVWRRLEFKGWDQTQNTIQPLMPTSFHLLTHPHGRKNGPQGEIFGAKFTSSFNFRGGFLSNLISLGKTCRSGGEGGEAGGKEGVDLKLLNVLFIREPLPGEE